MRDQAAIRLLPALLRKGDRVVTDPHDPRRPVDWTITSDPYPDRDVIAVDYVTDDGTRGNFGFESPVLWLMVVPAPTRHRPQARAARAVA